MGVICLVENHFLTFKSILDMFIYVLRRFFKTARGGEKGVKLLTLY